MVNYSNNSLSKFLSLILRHKPETINLSLDENGWADVNELIKKANQHNVPLTFEGLTRIVETNDKKRFVFSSDHQKIRASQGHSIDVDLQLKDAKPPDILYHGTAAKNLQSIRIKGLIKGERHHVHLSSDIQTAKKVGARYGQPFVIVVDACRMYQDNFKFFLSENNVWLTEHVPSQYLNFSLSV